MKSSVQHTINNGNFTFWAMYKGARVILLEARPVEASDFFRFHAIARANLLDLNVTMKLAA